jgi:hypothetical protein
LFLLLLLFLLLFFVIDIFYFGVFDVFVLYGDDVVDFYVFADEVVVVYKKASPSPCRDSFNHTTLLMSPVMVMNVVPQYKTIADIGMSSSSYSSTSLLSTFNKTQKEQQQLQSQSPIINQNQSQAQRQEELCCCFRCCCCCFRCCWCCFCCCCCVRCFCC